MCAHPQVEVKTKKGDVVPVSLWLRKIEISGAERRCVAVLEPVQRKTVSVSTAGDGERGLSLVFSYFGVVLCGWVWCLPRPVMGSPAVGLELHFG